MTVLVAALGLFYSIAGSVVLWRVRREWLLDRAIESLALQEPDRLRIAFMAVSALLYAAAGFALLLFSRWAVALLGAGLLVQGLYYAVNGRLAGRAARAASGQWGSAWNAAVMSAAAFAFAAYAHRLGLLV